VNSEKWKKTLLTSNIYLPNTVSAALVYLALSSYYQDMEMEYTYFEAEDGFFVGWFDKFPEDVTQGKSLEELEEMLADMYECLNLSP
jgi:hypothetical protein